MCSLAAGYLKLDDSVAQQCGLQVLSRLAAARAGYADGRVAAERHRIRDTHQEWVRR